MKRPTYQQILALVAELQNAMAEDPRGMLIRDLLDQLDIARNRGTVRVPVFPLAPGGDTHIRSNGR